MSPRRKVIDTVGRPRAAGYVRVFREPVRDVSMIRVQWNERGGVRTASYPDTRQGIAEAKAYARGVYDRLISAKGGPVFEPLSMRGVWIKYRNRKNSVWRDKTGQTAEVRWRKWERFIGDRTIAASVKRDRLDEFKVEMLRLRHAPNQVLAHLNLVTAVYRWAVDEDLIPPTKVASYKPEFSKEQMAGREQMAEYSREERDALIAALDPRKLNQWRAWALTTLFAFCGPRQNAARHLEWRDIDFDNQLITFRAELDKRGNERRQPMPAPVVDAFWVCYGWAIADKYDGPFVFYGAQVKTRERPYTYQGLNQMMRVAEDRAGITHIKYRSTHGHRRGVAGDIHAQTGSEKTAANYIGDKSVDVVRDSYLLEREEELRKTARMLEEKTDGR
jgi:integrase